MVSWWDWMIHYRIHGIYNGFDGIKQYNKLFKNCHLNLVSLIYSWKWWCSIVSHMLARGWFNGMFAENGDWLGNLGNWTGKWWFNGQFVFREMNHYPPANVYITIWKDPPFLMGTSTISLANFNSYVTNFQRVKIGSCSFSSNLMVFNDPFSRG